MRRSERKTRKERNFIEKEKNYTDGV